MDPITLAANRFTREHETAWNPPPGAKAPPILRLDADVGDRKNVLKTLRVLEWQPENRYPVSIVEAPFVDATTYLSSVLGHVRRDVEAVDAGLREDGVERRASPNRPHSLSPNAAVKHLEELASHLASALDGLVVVLAPTTVTNRVELIALIRAMLEQRKGPSALRLDVLATAVPELTDVLPIAARYVVDRDALFAYLKDLGQKGSEGPTEHNVPPLSPEKRRQIEAELGQPIVSVSTGGALKAFFLDGGRALAEGRPKEAVRKYRAARMLCELTGLKREALVATMALGNCYAALQNYRGAQAAYERARGTASELERPDLEAQALFGLGFIAMLERRFADARPLYQAILKRVAEDSPLHSEARRLVDACAHEDMMHGVETPAVHP